MDETFGTVLIAIAVVGALLACFSYVGSSALYRRLGRGDLALDEPDLRPSPQHGSAAWQAEADAELRQLVEAKSARREARGEAPLDVDAEVARLSSPPAAVDEGLREEVRELTIAANDRRVRRGQEPLDVDAEVERRLRELGA
jgi:hypothetical protein